MVPSQWHCSQRFTLLWHWALKVKCLALCLSLRMWVLAVLFLPPRLLLYHCERHLCVCNLKGKWYSVLSQQQKGLNIRLHPWSKLASWTSHINEFWVQLKDLASRNKVESDLYTHTQTDSHSFPNATRIPTCTAHIHTWGKRKGTVKKIQVSTTIFLWKKLCIYTSIKFSCLHPKIDNLPLVGFNKRLIFLTASFYLFLSWDMKFVRQYDYIINYN